MPETPEWYDPTVLPELRDAPPWVMEEMIAAEPTLPGRLGASLGDSAERLATAISQVVEAGEPLVVTGVGTSSHGARAAAMVLNDVVAGSPVAAGPAEFRQSSNQALAPRAGGLCLASSHGGTSRSTVAALRAARAAGARTAVITAAPGTAVCEFADLVLVTPLADASYCHTVGYLSPMLAAMAVASTYRGMAFPSDPLAAHLEQLVSLRPQTDRVAARLGGARRLVAAGSLVDHPTARELALKVAEGARLPCSAQEVEDTLHGHLAGHDADSALVAVATGGADAGPSGDRVADLLRAARHIGLRTAAIVSQPLVGTLDPDSASAGLVALPAPADVDLPATWTSLLGGALALQQLTLGLVHEAGVNPDLIRREEAPYREAAALGGAEFPDP